MPKFSVTSTMTTTTKYSVDLEAEDAEEAASLVEDMTKIGELDPDSEDVTYDTTARLID